MPLKGRPNARTDLLEKLAEGAFLKPQAVWQPQGNLRVNVFLRLPQFVPLRRHISCLEYLLLAIDRIELKLFSQYSFVCLGRCR